MARTEKEEMERAFELSLLDTSKPKTEEEQIKIAIKASTEDMSKTIPRNETRGACNMESWTWGADERREVEELIFAETPTSTEEVESLMRAMRKPLKMWPILHKLMDPIRKLLEPLTLFQWDGEQCEAWEHAKKYMLTELSHTDTDTDSEGGSQHQVKRASRKISLPLPQTNQSMKPLTGSVNDPQVTHSAAYT